MSAGLERALSLTSGFLGHKEMQSISCARNLKDFFAQETQKAHSSTA